ncbi:MAG: HAD family hydrolase [Candidatus Hodarchaeales archaeon]|jgi:phosphoglycolate phosphatase
MKTSLICFDFDGTIADSMPFLEKNAINLFINNYGTTFNDAQQKYRNTTGLPFEQQVKMIFPNFKQNGFVIKEFETQKIARIFDQELFPETKEVIKELKKKGYLIIISSSTTIEIITKYVEIKSISKFITEVLGYRPGFEKGKDHFKYIMQKYNLKPNDIIYIGDSIKDMERAYSSKIRFIGRLGPMFKADDFKIEIQEGKWHQYATITSLKEISELL